MPTTELPTWIVTILSNLGTGAIFFWLFTEERKARREERAKWELDMKELQKSFDAERQKYQTRINEVADKTTNAFVENTKVTEGMKSVQENTVTALQTLTQSIYDVIRTK